jgi:hypothetical protein
MYSTQQPFHLHSASVQKVHACGQSRPPAGCRLRPFVLVGSACWLYTTAVWFFMQRPRGKLHGALWLRASGSTDSGVLAGVALSDTECRLW